ncbi:pentapeptide repeat-containing protein [Nostoc foliaceum FACHB-393]|nr:pentapeptide repeat-containing protein [Nostoc foliaceum FACHB-393]
MTDYIKEISELMLTEDSIPSGIADLNKEKKLFIHALTLSTLRRFKDDAYLKGQVIQFLYESELIGFCKKPDNIVHPSEFKCLPKPIIELDYAEIDKADIKRARSLLPGLTLKQAHLEGAIFSEMTLGSANFEYAFLNKADFSGAVLDNANFTGANLNEANFSRAVLHDTNFKGTCLIGTDFRNAIGIDGEKFEGAIYSKETNFPPNFKIPGSMKEAHFKIKMQDSKTLFIGYDFC